jgi:hypothetical protein
MATEKQIAANRANAAKSTGPRSKAGKKRVSRNAVTHGLNVKYSSPELTRQLNERAIEIASDGDFRLEPALTVAEADLELVRVRRIEAGLTDRILALGSFEPPKLFAAKAEQWAWFRANMKWIKGNGPMPPTPVRISSADTMPASDPERTAEAVRRALSELTKLWRYERRALARRNSAIKALTAGPLGGPL